MSTTGKKYRPVKAYKDPHFLNSPSARPLRILAEYFEPQQRFDELRVRDTIVFFGSARILSREQAQHYVDAEKARGKVSEQARKQLELFGLWDRVISTPNLVLMQPIGYHDMLRLNMTAKLFLTDSGGLQEECTVLGTPCLTMRWNTERPVTLQEHGGASVLVGNNVERIREEYRKALVKTRHALRPELWDGKTAERCLEAILNAS